MAGIPHVYVGHPHPSPCLTATGYTHLTVHSHRRPRLADPVVARWSLWMLFMQGFAGCGRAVFRESWWWREVVVQLSLHGCKELLHGSGQSILQLVKCSTVGCIEVVESRVHVETEPVLQACYSLLDCSVDQLLDLVAFACLQVSGECFLQQGEG